MTTLHPPSDQQKRCPECGRGTLTDVAFDQGAQVDGRAKQESDSRQIETYSCGHTAIGARLSSADAGELEVERRTSDEGVVPPEPGDS